MNIQIKLSRTIVRSGSHDVPLNVRRSVITCSPAAGAELHYVRILVCFPKIKNPFKRSTADSMEWIYSDFSYHNHQEQQAIVKLKISNSFSLLFI